MKESVPSRPEVNSGSFRDFFAWREGRLFGLSYLVAITHGAVMTVVVLALLVWSLSGTVQALMVMAFIGLLRFANKAVAHFPSYATALFWALTLLASLRLYLGARRVTLPFLLTLAFSAVAIVVSVVASEAVEISVLKAVSFFVLSSAVLLAAETLKPEEALRLQRWLFSAVAIIAVLSLFTVPFPKVAFFRTGGFRGMFSHPQTAGVFFAPFAAWLITRIFVQPLRAVPFWVFAMAIFFSGIIVATGTRTAMLATFVSVGLTLVIVLVRGRTGAGSRSRGQIVGVIMVMVAASVGILASGALQQELEAVAFKDDDVEDLEEAFQHSRGGMVAGHLRNFAQAPLTGHGFGVFPEGVRGGEARIHRFMGIALSASAEKGVAFTSVLEEVGIFGGILFYALLLSIIARAAKGSNPSALAMVIAAIMVNVGEAIIFAINGLGLFMWVVIGFGLARARLDAQAEPSAEVDAATTRRRVPKAIGLRAR